MPRGKTQRNRDLIAAAYDILEAIQPASVRAVCYQLFIRGVIPNMSTQSTKRVSAQLVEARELDIIPWEWIVDETRSAERAQVWRDPAAYTRVVLNSYRRDFWDGQPVRLEVWSEKGTVRGTLAPVLNQFAITFRVLHGFMSATVAYDICEQSQMDDRPLTALYVGDYDPSGLYMSERDLPNRIERYDGEVNVERVALTATDTLDPALPSFGADTKSRDSRYAWFVARYGTQCWELDAMNPVLLRERVAERIEQLIDRVAWERYAQVEAGERQSLIDVMNQWPVLMRGPVRL